MRPSLRLFPLLGCAAPALLMAVLILAPFYDKAFTTDDTLFLREAQHALVDPVHPAEFDVVWDQDVPIRASAGVFITGPIMAYLLIPSVLAGGSELIAHVVQIVALGLAIVATVSLALRLNYSRREAMLTGAFVAATPAVLGMAGSSMPDVPAMAFGVIAIERFAAWTEQRRHGQALAAALFLSLGILTRCHLGWLLVVAGMLALAGGRTLPGWKRVRSPGSWWLPLAAAPALVIAYLLLTYDHSLDQSRVIQSLEPLFGWRQIPRNALAFGVHWMLVFPLGAAWLLLRWRSLPWRAGVCALAFWLILLPRSAPLWAAPVGASGFLVIFDVFRLGYRRADALQLWLGVWLLISLPTVFYIHHPAKYAVPAAPAVALLIVRQLRFAPQRWRFVIAGACISAGALLGIAILRADADLAGLGRRAAAELIPPAVQAGVPVWFAGHWGFQWYAEKAGARPLTRTPPHPRPGDLVVYSAVDECPALSYVPNRKLIRRWTFETKGGRVMSLKDHVGFYANTWGYLPWGWGSGELNRFESWRIE